MNILDVQKRVFPDIKELLKKEPESISSIEKNEDGGWILRCEVLEKKSIPNTYDLLKIFEFVLDNQAKITKFKQLGKVRRGDL